MKTSEAMRARHTCSLNYGTRKTYHNITRNARVFGATWRSTRWSTENDRGFIRADGSYHASGTARSTGVTRIHDIHSLLE
jgi:hypothetical protein